MDGVWGYARDKRQGERERRKPCITFICRNDLLNPRSLPVSPHGSLYGGVKQGFSKKTEAALKYGELSAPSKGLDAPRDFICKIYIQLLTCDHQPPYRYHESTAAAEFACTRTWHV